VVAQARGPGRARHHRQRRRGDLAQCRAPGWDQGQALALVLEKVHANTVRVLADAAALGVPPREAAEELARSRVAEATGYRRAW
jgi:hypothetical protein